MALASALLHFGRLRDAMLGIVTHYWKGISMHGS